MMRKAMDDKFIHTYLSVDCVVFGFDNNQLHILLVQRNAYTFNINDLKLPGSLIFEDEDVDDAAQRVLFELTGIKKMTLKQFRCFASPGRASKPEDMQWLDWTYQPNIDRLVTVAYLSLCKIDRKLTNISKYKSTAWIPIDQLPKMPFDHNKIVKTSMREIRNWVENEPAILFELLPVKFTETELRLLYEAVYNRKYDVRNFHKKIIQMKYVVPLDEKQENVNHRAARYYKFDRVIYKKWKIS
ncbi:MAG: NUDIX domain-containing protein [Dysgonamonadaceae bacterium]|jgi:ADP-ribose pyrophosphatase YjhB (NUDIX family)|nr:NUDIX domain-containing protein [Dysgonamonadaceae bacterium]